MAKHNSKCLMCGKSFTSYTLQSLNYCSVFCQLDPSFVKNPETVQNQAEQINEDTVRDDGNGLWALFTFWSISV